MRMSADNSQICSRSNVVNETMGLNKFARGLQTLLWGFQKNKKYNDNFLHNKDLTFNILFYDKNYTNNSLIRTQQHPSIYLTHKASNTNRL